MITRRSMFGLALVPWAPQRTGITRADVRVFLSILRAAIAGEAYGHWLVVSHQGFYQGESWIMSWEAGRSEFEEWMDNCGPAPRHLTYHLARRGLAPGHYESDPCELTDEAIFSV